MRPGTIIAFGFHDQSAPRHTNVCKTLTDEGFEIVECHTTKKGYFKKCKDLMRQFNFITKNQKPKTILVTFPGHHLVPLAWLLAKRHRMKLIFDLFISASDTLVSDRKKYSWLNPFAWFLYLVDFIDCHLADEILIDTKAHKTFIAKRFFVNPKRIRVIYLGTRDDLFFPKQLGNSVTRQRANILFYGTYIPLQGIEHIIDAAEILEHTHPKIHFTLIGKGQTYTEMRKRAEGLTNITFKDRVPYEELPDHIRKADVCLGIFGTSGKAQRVIPHKVYDAVACGVPVITADSPAMREKFTDGQDVVLCRAGDPHDLAENIVSVCK